MANGQWLMGRRRRGAETLGKSDVGCGGRWSVVRGPPALSEVEGWSVVRGRRSDGFTLIELLVVILIMTILMVAAIPAFNTFTKKGMKTAVPPLTATLRLARQYAITHRQWVWVVFPDRDNALYDGGLQGEVVKALRSYAVIASNSVDGRLEYVTDWRYLPEGIYFDEEGAEDSVNVFESYGPGATTFPFPDDRTIPFNVLPAILFKPNGRCYDCCEGSWSDFGFTWIPFRAGYAEPNTNTGTMLPPTWLSPSNIVVRTRNKTGQIDVMYNE